MHLRQVSFLSCRLFWAYFFFPSQGEYESEYFLKYSSLKPDIIVHISNNNRRIINEDFIIIGGAMIHEKAFIKWRWHSRFLAVLLLSSFSFSACSYCTVSKEMLLPMLGSRDQLKPRTVSGEVAYGAMLSMPYSDQFPGNDIREIACIRSDGKKILVKDNNTVQLIVKDRNGNSYRMYLSTLFIEDSKLKGLRSRKYLSAVEIDLDQIESMQIQSELAKTEELPN
jgi:hypothetical protein